MGAFLHIRLILATISLVFHCHINKRGGNLKIGSKHDGTRLGHLHGGSEGVTKPQYRKGTAAKGTTQQSSNALSRQRQRPARSDSPMKMCMLVLSIASATSLFAQLDAHEIILRAVTADSRNWKVARNYTFSERVDMRRLDAHGHVDFKELKTYVVRPLEGSSYRLLTARDDRPLAASEAKLEQEKLARNTVERRSETGPQRIERLAAYERPEWQRDAWRELPEAFDFRLDKDEVLGGQKMFVIYATPREGYQPQSRTARIFSHLQGKLWIGQQDYQLAKAEVEVTVAISAGLFLIRVAKGSHAELEQIRVNSEVWLPHRMQAVVSARVGLLRVVRIEQEVSYSDCRLLPAISSILPWTITK